MALSPLVPDLRIFRIAYVARLLYATQAARGPISSAEFVEPRIACASSAFPPVGWWLCVGAVDVISLVGAAVMYFFESSAPGKGWVLAFLLSLFALTMYEYITATLATFSSATKRRVMNRSSPLSG